MTPPGKLLRAAVYGRESKGKTKSVADQVAVGLATLAEQGWTHAGSYDDLTSASRYARKGRADWARLLADLDAGRLDVVVVWETTRADRKLTSWVELLERCRDRGVRIHVVADERTYDPRRARDYKDLASAGVDASYETDRLGERVARGHLFAARAGRPNGAVPYGYVRTYDPESRDPIQQAHPDEAPVVAEIVARVADGHPVKAVADDLNARAVPTRYGGPWLFATVRRIAQNPAYIGRRRHNGGADTYPALWPPIVDEERFWAAQRIFAARKGLGWRAGRAEHLLTGVGKCSLCGSGYAGRIDARRGGRRRYGCRRGCGYVDGPDYEDLVLAYVLGRLARPDVHEQLRRAGEGGDQEVIAARAQVAAILARIEAARASAARPDGISYEALAVQERALNDQLTKARRRAQLAGVPPAVRALVDAGEDLVARWEAMPLAARRDVVRDLVSVVVAPVGQGRKVPVAQRVVIEWKGTG
jgi:DNA invertase Pin-like site-specific DNA recombinase